MKVDFNKELKSLEGEIVYVSDETGKLTTETVNLGKRLANVLANQAGSENETETIRHISWAMDLIKNKPLELSKADVKDIKEFIAKSKAFNQIIKYQYYEILDAKTKKQ